MKEFAYFCENLPNKISLGIALLIMIFSVLFAYFYSGKKGKKLEFYWYLFVFMVPVLGVISLLLRERKKPLKKGEAQAASELPEPEEANAPGKAPGGKPGKNKAKAVLSGICLSVTALLLAVFVSVLAFGADISRAVYEKHFPECFGVSYEGRYYDRNGNEYESFLDVPLFTENGEKFIYNRETNRYESEKRSLGLDELLVNGEGYAVFYQIPEDADTASYFQSRGAFKNRGIRVIYSEEDVKEIGFDPDKDNWKQFPKKYSYYPCPLIGWNDKGELIFSEWEDTVFYYDVYIDMSTYGDFEWLLADKKISA